MTKFSLNTGNNVKPFKTIEQQLDLLESRGLIIPDRNNAAAILERTSYYRFSAYSLTLRSHDCFHDGVTFDNVYELYRFDDAFRKIVIVYTSYVEISFRAHIAYEHGRKYGPLGYMQPSNFSDEARHQVFIDKLSNEIKRSDDAFVHHHREDRDCIFPVCSIWVGILIIKQLQDHLYHLFVEMIFQFIYDQVTTCSEDCESPTDQSMSFDRSGRNNPIQLDRISGLKNVIIVLKFQSPLKSVIDIICCPQIFDIVIERIQDSFWRFSQHWRNEMVIDP